MGKISEVINNKRNLIIKISVFFLILIGVFYTGISVYSYVIVSSYDDKTLPNISVGGNKISTINTNQVKNKIQDIENKIIQSKIIFKYKTTVYEYTLSDLGVRINKDEIFKEVMQYQDKLSYLDKFKTILDKQSKDFSYKLVYSEEKINEIIIDIKSKVDCNLVEGKLIMNSNRNLVYDKGKDSFSLDIEKTINNTKKVLNNFSNNNVVQLVGTSVTPKIKKVSVINTKISSFSTEFNPKLRRGTNIKTAAKYIDGIIIEPGSTFSFYKYAGPYSKKGYVYDSMVIGNGVCQVATTIYNTALTAGVKIVDRNQHAAKSTYVDGGLDATVASGIDGRSKVDFKFKNTLSYPIYISAYVKNKKIVVEFWSNDKATGGITYKTESVKIGYNGYKTYLHIYKNGKEIEKRSITTSWYLK